MPATSIEPWTPRAGFEAVPAVKYLGQLFDHLGAYRGGFERCGKSIATIGSSFDLEETIRNNPHVGTWIIDEAAFYDERLAYLVKREAEQRGLVFVMPTLLLNFRGEIFNQTARLLMETSTDIYPLSAYCEHGECLEHAYNTYRYYVVDGVECPALFFDPLIIVGGDRDKNDPREPNYCTRCDEHHYLPGKEYTFRLRLIYKPYLSDQDVLAEVAKARKEMEGSTKD